MTPLWIEICRLVASIVLPIVVAVIGHKLLRRVEEIKTLVVKQSEFDKKWAEEFFACGQQFRRALERNLALLTLYARERDKNERFHAELVDEIWRLNVTLSELELRIRLCVVFAKPTSAEAVKQAAHDCVSLTSQLFDSGKGNADSIIGKMDELNRASRKAHAEILGLGAAKSAGS